MDYEVELNKKRIRIIGNQKNVEIAKELLSKIEKSLTGRESEDRLLIQDHVSEKVRVTILYDGNTVYGEKQLLTDLDKCIEDGMESLSNDLYEFFHLYCGTIAHYNREGWIDQYPELSMVYHMLTRCITPDWKTDQQVIVRAMIKKLEKVVE